MATIGAKLGFATPGAARQHIERMQEVDRRIIRSSGKPIPRTVQSTLRETGYVQRNGARTRAHVRATYAQSTEQHVQDAARFLLNF